ncbi:unnamed protein product [Paramecium primaurelia]|uniref:Transmembrane protein n=1 Tax=Paramecium primaurelia TaxID=5886 RepID=A0A8S1LD33_PARPR|nr:unnamed protein product [Paramecium primaurelia]
MQQKCCCLPTQKAFLMIVYLDISRIIWGTVACAFMFQKDSSLSLIISIMDIIIIVFQSSVALYINMRALKQQNKKPIFIYRKLKVLSICFNILDRLIVPIINCTLIFKDVITLIFRINKKQDHSTVYLIFLLLSLQLQSYGILLNIISILQQEILS